jgi:PhzF family phenazine biosynthesis protein
MQRIAFENGLAETAFLAPEPGADGRFRIRWFTPQIEVDLCGHATLASAFVLFSELGLGGERVVFESRSGPLAVVRLQDGKLELDFPSRPPRPAPAELIAPLTEALGATPRSVGQARDSVCVFDRAEDVTALRPDFGRLVQLDTFAVIATAPGRAGDCDFVSRFFAPRAGVPEDPVTGSAHCTLAPYWAEVFGKKRLHARQLSARGGELFCEVRCDRVGVGGHAVLYLRGEIQLAGWFP